MSKDQSQKVINACKKLGVPATSVTIAENEYSVFVFYQSEIIYRSYQAARLFLMSREIETGKSV